jgi:hypothetical protein
MIHSQQNIKVTDNVLLLEILWPLIFVLKKNFPVTAIILHSQYSQEINNWHKEL